MIAALPRLHAVTDDRVLARDVREPAAAMAAAAGPALAVHLRSRTLEGRAFLALAQDLGALLAPHGSWLVVNGRADVARAAGARLLVLGRGGLSVSDAKKVTPQALVARSVHNEDDVRRAAEADVLIAGRKEAGLEAVRSAAGTGKPVIAIGGIDPAGTAEALDAGAWGVAAIRALWDAPDPARAAGAFLAVLPADDTVAVVINGQPRRARAGLSLAGLLGDLGLDPRAVVVEHNRHIVRRGGLETARIGEGDAIELVHFVGGG